MGPLKIYRWESVPTLMEIDDFLRAAAGVGFAGAVVAADTDFLSPPYFEALRGAARSAYRLDIGLYVAADSGPFFGCGGGEVTSVPEFRAKNLFFVPETELSEGERPLAAENGLAAVARRAVPENGFCPVDCFSPRAAKAFIDCVCRRIRREASRFFGREIKGLYIGEPLTGTIPWSDRLSAYIKEKTGAEPEPMRLLSDPAAREDYMALARELRAQTFFSPIADWCAENGLEAIGPGEGGAALTFSSELAGDPAADFRSLNLALASGAEKIVVDGEAPAELAAAWLRAAERLGHLLRGAKKRSVQAGAVVLRAVDGAMTLKLYANISDAPLSLDVPLGGCAYVYDPIVGETGALPRTDGIKVRLSPGGSLAVLLSDEPRPAAPAPAFTRSGALLGETGEGTPLELAYMNCPGSPKLELILPDELAPGSAVLLSGGLLGAELRIGRRRESLVLPPFLFPLYASDGGRTLEIRLLFSDTSDNSPAGAPVNAQLVTPRIADEKNINKI